MFDLQLLPTYGLGEVLDTGEEFMPGLGPETIKATLVEVEENKYWEFNLTYYGVFIGKACVERHNGKLEWNEL